MPRNHLTAMAWTNQVAEPYAFGLEIRPGRVALVHPCHWTQVLPAIFQGGPAIYSYSVHPVLVENTLTGGPWNEVIRLSFPAAAALLVTPWWFALAAMAILRRFSSPSSHG